MDEVFIEWLREECPGEDITLMNYNYSARFGWFFWNHAKQVHEKYDLTDLCFMGMGFSYPEVREMTEAMPRVAYRPRY